MQRVEVIDFFHSDNKDECYEYHSDNKDECYEYHLQQNKGKVECFDLLKEDLGINLQNWLTNNGVPCVELLDLTKSIVEQCVEFVEQIDSMEIEE